MTSRIRFAARSETGKVRTNNEDNLYCNGIIMSADARDRPFFLAGMAEVPAVFAVCDGMGGESCGEVASLVAVESLGEHSEAIKNTGTRAVQDYVSDANSRLLGIMREQNIRMGTTLALVVAGDEAFTAYNLGDSRIYRVKEGRLLRITDDHTVAEDKMRMGYLTALQAERSRERHILTRCLGIDEYEAVPDVSEEYDFRENRRILLSSDGLNEMVSFRDIAAIMKNAQNVNDAVNNLVDAALFNGGHDNVTCIVLEAISE